LSFHDHFSGHAQVYAASRPDYPAELYDFLASTVKRQHIAWDCAAGNGQATTGLMPYFDTVLMTDASEKQIAQASHCQQTANVQAGVMLAESLAIRAGTVDLAVVAQALHWFNLEQFFAELDRVLCNEGVFATWSYGQHTISDDCDALVQTLYEDVLGDYWAPQRRMVEAGYAGIEFPFEAVTPPDFKLQKQWSIEQVLAYLNSWSAVQRYIESNGANPVDEFAPEFREVFGVNEIRTITWPLTLIVRRKLN